jgi:uncharacterized protein YjbI with pentapeptide repeats
LQVADLRGTDLRVTDLQGTNLYEVDLRGVDLRDAILQGAINTEYALIHQAQRVILGLANEDKLLISAE